MNILLISECSKQALPATRRVIDQFAERTGRRTWLAAITEAGLRTLHQMVRRTARRNTAVACHWIKSGETELLWIVGNRRRFGPGGVVPTNTSERHRPLGDGDNSLRSTGAIALLAGIAGLFHDVGKATDRFQRKLQPRQSDQFTADPVRHEWVSLMIFRGFVGDDSDADWLARLGRIGPDDEAQWIEAALASRLKRRTSPLHALGERPVAWAVGWLILSHHRLPYNPDKPTQGEQSSEHIGRWPLKLNHQWNAWREETFTDWPELLRFPGGTPASSATWRQHAASLARRVERHPELPDTNWRDDTLALHLARCALMLADHHYSGADTTPRWQDASYAVWANTRKAEDVRVFHQRLDEHCIGVSRQAYLLAMQLPTLRQLLPALGDIRSLRKPSKGAFAWQNRAFALARQAAAQSSHNGAFIVNLASTGTGKTLANARIAYGLNGDAVGCRFNVLLGLRSLTLQTGDALRDRIGLTDDDLAVLVGGGAMQTWHRESRPSGSDSDAPLFAEHEFVRYDGALDQTRFGEWLRGRDTRTGSGTLHRLLSAPVLVSTIDHLMPATESQRGGGQIAPMLRLLSADTILDEPDDFDLTDQHALCRLTHFIGLLGGRVVLSSATLPPSLVEALWAAYRSGRMLFNRATTERPAPPICGWVDEFRTHSASPAEADSFAAAHRLFIDRRLRALAGNTAPLRRAALIEIPDPPASDKLTDHIPRLVDTLCAHIDQLSAAHDQTAPDGEHRVSIGLVRLANIVPLVAVSRELAKRSPPPDSAWHLCVYHSQHPFLRRLLIEQRLDSLLRRHDPDAIWAHPDVHAQLRSSRRRQVFVVLATAVAEVGRDHDYDWAIVEPSSMRSIIQLAGRVQRHRQQGVGDAANMALLGRNIRDLRGMAPAFCKPGYESKALPLAQHHLAAVIPEADYRHPSAACRIAEPSELRPAERLVDLEHHATRQALLGGGPEPWPACVWWEQPVDWTWNLQRLHPFRDGRPTDDYALIASAPGDEPVFSLLSAGEAVPCTDRYRRVALTMADGIHRWPAISDGELLEQLDERPGELAQTCRRWMQVQLAHRREDAPGASWQYHPWLGFSGNTDG